MKTIDRNLNKINLSIVRHYILCALVFFIGLEYWDALKLASNFTISKALGIAYLFIGLLSYKTLFRLRKSNFATVAILLFFYFIYITSAFNSYVFYSSEISIQGLIIPFQFILLFALIVSDISSYPTLKNKVIISFVLGALTIYVLLMNGIGIQAGKDEAVLTSTDEVVRVWFMGMNPNDLGNIGVLAILAIFYMAKNMAKSYMSKAICFILIAPLLHLIVLSGSLGAYISLFIGLFILLFNYKIFNKKTILSTFILVPLIFYVLNSFDFSFLSNRFHDFITTGNTSGRTNIWSTNINFLMDYPIIGVGPFSNLRTSHNMLIDAFVWGGMLGLMVYTAFLITVLKNAYENYKKNKDIFYMAIFTVLLFILFKSGGAFKIKYIWLFLALVSSLPLTKKGAATPEENHYEKNMLICT